MPTPSPLRDVRGRTRPPASKSATNVPVALWCRRVLYAMLILALSSVLLIVLTIVHFRWRQLDTLVRLAGHTSPKSPGPPAEPPSSAPVQHRFFFPDAVHYGLVDPSADPCRDMFDHACGHWRRRGDRLFAQTRTENRRSLARAGQLIRTGTANHAHSTPLLAGAEILGDWVTHASGQHSETPDDDGGDDGGVQAARNIHLFYDTCMHFFAASACAGPHPRDADDSGPMDGSPLEGLHPHLRRIVHSLGAALLTSGTHADTQRPPSPAALAHAFGILHRSGLASPLDVGVRELPYAEGGGARPVALEFSATPPGETTRGAGPHLYANMLCLLGAAVETPSNSARTVRSGQARTVTFERLRRAVRHLDIDALLTHAELAVDPGHTVIVADWAALARLDAQAGRQSAAWWHGHLVHAALRSALALLGVDGRATAPSPAASDAHCLALARRFFPVSACRAFVHAVPDFEAAQRAARDTARGVLRAHEALLRDTLGADAAQLRQLADLEISIGECHLAGAARRVSHVAAREADALEGADARQLLLRPADDGTRATLLDVVLRYAGDRRFRLHRRRGAFYDQWAAGGADDSQGGADEYADTNAWYDAVHHRVVVPPGLVRFPVASGSYDAASRYALFGFIVAHEVAHATERPRVPPATQMCLAALYAGGPPRTPAPDWGYGQRTALENRADILGLRAAHDALVATHGGPLPPELLRRFFLASAQVWCAGGGSTITHGVHAAPRDRVNRVLYQVGRGLRTQFREAFGCASSGDETPICAGVDGAQHERERCERGACIFGEI